MGSKIMAAFAAAVLCSAIGIAGSGIATAAPRANDESNGRLCDVMTSNPSLCWANDGHATDSVTTEPYRSDSQDQAIDVLPPTNTTCGDNVVNEHTACPFTPGSGLNTRFNGDAIVNIQSHYPCLQGPKVCLRYSANNANTGVVAEPFSDTIGSLWVQEGCTDPATACAPAAFINVSASNAMGAAMYAYTQGSGQQVGLSFNTYSCYVSGTQFFSSCLR